MIVYECRVDKTHNQKVFKGGRPGLPPVCCGIGMRKLRPRRPTPAFDPLAVSNMASGFPGMEINQQQGES